MRTTSKKPRLAVPSIVKSPHNIPELDDRLFFLTSHKEQHNPILERKKRQYKTISRYDYVKHGNTQEDLFKTVQKIRPSLISIEPLSVKNHYSKTNMMAATMSGQNTPVINADL